MRQRALFTGCCIAPTLGGASGVQLSCFPISHITIHITPSDSSPLGLIYQPACGAQRCGEGRAAASLVHWSLHRPHMGGASSGLLSCSTITHPQAIHITPSASSPGGLSFQPTCGAHKYEIEKAIHIPPFTFHIPHSTFHFVAFRQMTHNEPLAPLGRVQDTSPTAHNRNIRHRHRHCRRCPCS